MAEKNSLWKNIRANRGSGKKPTAEMLRQERKIKAKYPDGGPVKDGYLNTPVEQVNTGSLYNPVSNRIHSDPSDPSDALPHEYYHAWQHQEGRDRLPELYDGPLRQPQTPYVDELTADYYNRRGFEENAINSEFKSDNPSFNFVPDNVMYDKYTNAEMYNRPYTLEGEARATESPEGREWLKNEGMLPEGIENMYNATGGPVKRGFLEEREFRKEYDKYADATGNATNPYDVEHYYNYSKLYDETGGIMPHLSEGHLPSEYKELGHPNLYIEGRNTKTFAGGGPTKPIYISDPNKFKKREQAYKDSSDVYNAVQFLNKNIPTATNALMTSNTWEDPIVKKSEVVSNRTGINPTKTGKRIPQAYSVNTGSKDYYDQLYLKKPTPVAYKPNPVAVENPHSTINTERLEPLGFTSINQQEELGLKDFPKQKAYINRGANSGYDANGNPLVSEINKGNGKGWEQVPYNTLDQYEEIKAQGGYYPTQGPPKALFKGYAEGGYTNPYNMYHKDPHLQYANGGRTWKNIGAGAFGALEGIVDTTFGWVPGVDMATDMAYKGLQKLGRSTEDEKREQDSIHGYGQTAGAVGSAILTGGATTASAISEGSQGLGQGISRGNETSDVARGIGTGLGIAGGVAGTIYGSTEGAKEAKSQFKTSEAGSQGLGKFAASAPIKGFSAAPKGTMQGVLDGNAVSMKPGTDVASSVKPTPSTGYFSNPSAANNINNPNTFNKVGDVTNQVASLPKSQEQPPMAPPVAVTPPPALPPQVDYNQFAVNPPTFNTGVQPPDYNFGAAPTNNYFSQGGNITNNSLNLRNTMRYKKFAKGGTFDQYGINYIPESAGLHHENAYGGVPIGPDALAEGGEIKMDTGDGGQYIVSDQVDGAESQKDFTFSKGGKYKELNRTLADGMKQDLKKYSMGNLATSDRVKDDLRRPNDSWNSIDQVKKRWQEKTEYARQRSQQEQAIAQAEEQKRMAEEQYIAAYGGKINPKKYPGLNYAKGGIHIKPENKGKFTASAKAAGHSVQEHAASVLRDPNATPLQKKRANFARNAAGWKHADGGYVYNPMTQPMLAEGGPLYGDPASPYTYTMGGPNKPWTAPIPIGSNVQQGSNSTLSVGHGNIDNTQFGSRIINEYDNGLPNDTSYIYQSPKEDYFYNTGQNTQNGKPVSNFNSGSAAPLGNNIYQDKIKKLAGYARGGMYGDPYYRGGEIDYTNDMYAGGGPMVSNVNQPFKGPAAQNRGGMYIYPDGGMMPPEQQMMQEQQMQQQAPQEQQGGQDQMMQMVQQVEQMLQQGAQPEQVMQQLVQSGVPQDMAMQAVQMAMQDMQGQQQQQPMQGQEQPMPQSMANGGIMYPDGDRKVYTDLKTFQNANTAYKDSLDTYSNVNAINTRINSQIAKPANQRSFSNQSQFKPWMKGLVNNAVSSGDINPSLLQNAPVQQIQHVNGPVTNYTPVTATKPKVRPIFQPPAPITNSPAVTPTPVQATPVQPTPQMQSNPAAPTNQPSRVYDPGGKGRPGRWLDLNDDSQRKPALLQNKANQVSSGNVNMLPLIKAEGGYFNGKKQYSGMDNTVPPVIPPTNPVFSPLADESTMSQIAGLGQAVVPALTSAYAFNKLSKRKLTPSLTPEVTIDYTPARTAMMEENRRNVSSGLNAMRNVAPTSGSFMGNARGAVLDANKLSGEQIAKSWQDQKNKQAEYDYGVGSTNAGIKNKINELNEEMYQNAMQTGFESAGQGVKNATEYYSDLENRKLQRWQAQNTSGENWTWTPKGKAFRNKDGVYMINGKPVDPSTGNPT
jgi:hypothetical protein